ncbi:DapH/DapD/GlmU-related protein [Mucilaginibacter paludis]|uniref:Transferase hexapeptide repeat containing protein n=1 Tax=Mucilaginibacter paludis DSM 18603 TaxID=714943 RepID=H1YIJ6_9SPHI|nr:DapH/DapD/GlmU-related protein [Mucilaginibacter paludis]EHQ26562.1 transferase hexapeptide repeat containing protein [Mucilaginibacter paludis DSM 18603]
MFYKLILRSLIIFLSLLPLSYVIFSNSTHKIILFPLLLISTPFSIIILTGILLKIHPTIKNEAIEPGTKKFFYWLNKNFIHEFVCSSSFLNNLTNRIDFLRIFYYKLCGIKNPLLVIIAPDVKFLDPYLLVLGKKIFIGYGTIISGHIIQGRKLLVDYVKIGDNVRIGASCFISCGVEIQESTMIGFGVKIGSNCKIGKNVIISSETTIDDNVIIEDNVIIGKFCIVGKNSIIKNKSVVSFNQIIKPRSIIDFRKNK